MDDGFKRRRKALVAMVVMPQYAPWSDDPDPPVKVMTPEQSKAAAKAVAKRMAKRKAEEDVRDTPAAPGLLRRP